MNHLAGGRASASQIGFKAPRARPKL